MIKRINHKRHRSGRSFERLNIINRLHIGWARRGTFILGRFSFILLSCRNQFAFLSKSICVLVEINLRSCRNQFAFLSKSICDLVEINLRFCRKPFLQQFTDFILYSKKFPSSKPDIGRSGLPNGLTHKIKSFGSPEAGIGL